MAWGKHAESVRKDVECAFGRLKGRFRCLKIPARFESQETVADQFRACVCLHNMCHDWDGLGARWDKVLLVDHGDSGDIDDTDTLDKPGYCTLAQLRKRYRKLLGKLQKGGTMSQARSTRLELESQRQLQSMETVKLSPKLRRGGSCCAPTSLYILPTAKRTSCSPGWARRRRARACNARVHDTTGVLLQHTEHCRRSDDVCVRARASAA